MNGTYDFRKTLTIGDTNAMGNVYFAEYFKLQGTIRELWVKDRVENGMNLLREGLILSTKSAHCDFKKPFFVFDTILCKMHFEDLQRVSVKLVFEFYNADTMQLHASGWQIVVFKDSQRKTCRMPIEFQQAAIPIVWGSSTPTTLNNEAPE